MDPDCKVCRDLGYLISIKYKVCENCEGKGETCSCGEVCLACLGLGYIYYLEKTHCLNCHLK